MFLNEKLSNGTSPPDPENSGEGSKGGVNFNSDFFQNWKKGWFQLILLKPYLKITIIAILLSSLQACGQEKVESKAYQVMLQGLLSHSVDEVFVSDQLSPDTNIVYLDARERAEYDVSHINNAIWVGYDDFNVERVKELHKNDSILVYCSVGYRSEKIAEKLKENGFEKVTNLYGGIFEWKNQNLPIINSDGETTDSIHAFDRTWGIWLRKGVKVY